MHTRASVEKCAFPGDLVMKFRSMAAEPDLAEGHEPSEWLQAGCSQPNGVSVSWINPNADWISAVVALSASVHHNQGIHRCM